MAMEITQVLLNAQSADTNVRKQAEDTLRQFQEQSLPVFLLSLSGELAGEDKPVDSRKLAGWILKNYLDAKEQNMQRWLALDVAVKSQIKACLLQTLSSPVPDARSKASQVIGKVAGMELPQKQWPELLGSLLSNAQPVSAHVKQVTLEALGYLCEEVSPDVLDQHHIDKILTNLSNDMECDFIMTVVCEATLSSDVRIRQAAFKCLVAISSTYYEKLAIYIDSIFYITAKAVREDEEHVAIQAIEFWSSVYGVAFTADSEVPCFIKGALHDLVPLLLETLEKQKEDQDQDEGAWNLARAGRTCLGLVARTVGDDIVPLVKPFIEANITGPGWRQREAATYAFGSIMEGPSPDKLTPIVKLALNIMVDALTKDPNSHEKDTTEWTIGRIFEFVRGSTVIFTSADIQRIISALLLSKNDAQNVSEKACRALYFLARRYKDVGSSSPVNLYYFWQIVKSLVCNTNCEDAGESRLRAASYETLTEVVSCSTESDFQVLELLPIVIVRLEQTVEAHKLSSDERERRNELQGLCGCLLVIIQKLVGRESMKYYLMMYVNLIMDIVLDVLACRIATVHKNAMLIIGALATAATPASATDPDFAIYLPVLYEYLEMGLKNIEEDDVCAATIGVVGAICRLVGDKILPYSDRIMTEILKHINSPQLHPSVRPPIFSCFGDIALSVRENFERYLVDVMRLLKNAAVVEQKKKKKKKKKSGPGLTSGAYVDMIKYTNLLRNGILKAYYGILRGFKNTSKAQVLVPYVEQIGQIIESIYRHQNMDDEVTKTAIRVIGILADTLGNEGVSMIKCSHPCLDILGKGLYSEDLLIKGHAERAKEAIYHAVYARPADSF